MEDPLVRRWVSLENYYYCDDEYVKNTLYKTSVSRINEEWLSITLKKEIFGSDSWRSPKKSGGHRDPFRGWEDLYSSIVYYKDLF